MYPVITQCCIHELYLQGKSQQSATDLAKTFERRRCNHKEAIPGDDCLMSVVGAISPACSSSQCIDGLFLSCFANAGDTNKHRYVITTQSHPLRTQLRTVSATPIVHINRSVVILEPPSDITLQAKAKVRAVAIGSAVL